MSLLLMGVATTVAAQDGSVTLRSLFNNLKGALEAATAGASQEGQAPAASSEAPSESTAAAMGDEIHGQAAPRPTGEQAVARYTNLIREIHARGQVREHEWGQLYLKVRDDVQAYTGSSIAGVYALRLVRPEDPAELRRWAATPMAMLMEGTSVVLFDEDGNRLFVRQQNFAKGTDAWMAYDRRAGGWQTGEAARPYVQQMLTSMDTTALPQVGRDRPTFILYTSPSCPYSAKVEPLLAKSGLSYRVFPTFTINPGLDWPHTHKIFCASDKLAAWKKAVGAKPLKPVSADENWWCSPPTMPVMTMADLNIIFGQGHMTPSFYFADGTVISGANNVEAVKRKAKEMQDLGVTFR